jgi:3-oxoacyl-[acyl-carrier protein] reductase
MDKQRKNILVTGASRGIGRAILDDLILLGHNVIGHASLDAPGIIGQDLCSQNGPAALWAKALKQFNGRMDVLINNAGIFEANPIQNDASDWMQSWDRTMQINLNAPASLCRLAVLHWQNTKAGGRIVNIASRAAYRGDSPDHWHYAASKAGMVAMTKTIARAYAAQDIYAFAICPGFTMTGMAEDYLASRGGDKLLADIPLGRVADPQEIASIANYCALNAPASMTGAILDANGASYVR